MHICTFNNTVHCISQMSVLWLNETGEPRKKHWPSVSHWQTWSHKTSFEYTSPCTWSHACKIVMSTTHHVFDHMRLFFVHLVMFLIIWDWFEYTLLYSWSHEIILSTSHLITWNLSEYTSPCTSTNEIDLSTSHHVQNVLDHIRSFWVHLTLCLITWIVLST